MKFLRNRLFHCEVPPSERAAIWIAVGIVLRLTAFSFFMFSAHSNDVHPERGLLFLTGGDSDSYILPAENLLNHGSYIQDLYRPESKAGRMPGYSATYLLFRFATDPETAKSCLTIFQVLLGGVSIYYLALLARNLFQGNERVFQIAFLLFGTSTYVSQMDVYLLTESLAVSSIIFAGYCLERFIATRRQSLLLLSGTWLTYSIFLRPYVIVVLPIFALGTFFSSRRPRDFLSIAEKIRNAMFLMAPFIAADGAWIVRNYHALHYFVPAQINLHAGYDQPRTYWAFQKFCNTVGEDMVYWKPNTLGTWFFPEARFSTTGFFPPSRIFARSYGLADLESVRQRYRLLANLPGRGIGSGLDLELAKELDRFALEFRRENPLTYHVISPLRSLISMLIHSGPQYMPLKASRELVHNPPAMLVKIFSVLSYWFIIVFGLIFIFLNCGSRDQVTPFFLATPVLILLLLSFGFRCTEDRYILPAFPFLALFAAGGMGSLFNRVSPPRFVGKKNDLPS